MEMHKQGHLLRGHLVPVSSGVGWLLVHSLHVDPDSNLRSCPWYPKLVKMSWTFYDEKSIVQSNRLCVTKAAFKCCGHVLQKSLPKVLENDFSKYTGLQTYVFFSVLCMHS